MTGDGVERPFSLEEERRVREAFTMGAAVECPRCGVPMRRREIGGGSFGLGYARRREWFLCPSCRGSVLFDAERGTRL